MAIPSERAHRSADANATWRARGNGQSSFGPGAAVGTSRSAPIPSFSRAGGKYSHGRFPPCPEAPRARVLANPSALRPPAPPGRFVLDLHLQPISASCALVKPSGSPQITSRRRHPRSSTCARRGRRCRTTLALLFGRVGIFIAIGLLLGVSAGRWEVSSRPFLSWPGPPPLPSQRLEAGRDAVGLTLRLPIGLDSERF